MKELLLAALMAACPITKTVNKTQYPWNEHDKETQAYCGKRCAQIYPEAPCLKLFVKWDKQDYHCICGI